MGERPYDAAVERLASVPELLDGPLDNQAELIANLRDLRRVNRLVGAPAMSWRAIDALANGTAQLSILDVGTGAADLPAAWLARAREDGRTLRVTAVDVRREVVDAARALDPVLDQTPGLALGVADGRRLPYADAAFDVGHISMVVHHLEPDEAIPALRELRRVSRSGVVVNDLARGLLNWLGALVLTRTIARAGLTRHDGPLSVRRAYTAREMTALIERAGMTPVATVHGFARHRYAIAAQ